MERLTSEDHGKYIVETQGSIHLWEITEDGVTITRNPDMRDSMNPYGLDVLNGKPYEATVIVWPEVGGMFITIINGGISLDFPNTRSSLIRSITEA